MHAGQTPGSYGESPDISQCNTPCNAKGDEGTFAYMTYGRWWEWLVYRREEMLGLITEAPFFCSVRRILAQLGLQGDASA